MDEYLIPLTIIGLLVLINGFFVAAEFAIVAAPRTRIAQAAERGSGTARNVLDILNSSKLQNYYLATAQVGIAVASLGLGMYGEHTVAEWLVGPLSRIEVLTAWSETIAHTLATVLAIGLLTYLHVVVGEMVPKSLAIQYAEPAVLRLDAPMRITRKIFWPVVFVLNGIGNVIVRLMGIPPAGAQARLFSPQELEFIVEESAEGGLVEPGEQLFIENIFDLRERTVGEVMTPRNTIVGIPVTAGEEDVLQLICEERHSRYPVYDDDLDEIVGVLHAKTLARQQANREAQPFDLSQLVRPVLYVPESLTLDRMLVSFRRDRGQLAVVVDEYGGTAGLVTLEDVIEQVVGEIQDEFDQEQPPIETVTAGLIRVRGDLLVEELNQLYDLGLEHPEANTIGGLVMAQLGRVAQPGDVVEAQGIIFEVEAVRGLAVQTVLVRLTTPEEIDSS